MGLGSTRSASIRDGGSFQVFRERDRSRTSAAALRSCSITIGLSVVIEAQIASMVVAKLPRLSMRKPHRLFLIICLFGLRALGTELQPFTLTPRAVDASSRIDLSGLHEKPAGRTGFLSARDGHIVRPDGTRQRLWGVNITDWTPGSVQIPDKDDAEFQARTLARAGVNVVRLTFLDFTAPRGVIDATRNDTRALDAGQMDKLDWWIAALKKAGIYTDLNLVVGRTYKPGDGVTAAAEIGWAKALTIFDPKLIELTKEFAHQLLTHRNPYTNTEYRHEPAIAIVEVLNENSLFDAWYNDRLRPLDSPVRDPNFRPIPAHYSAMLDDLYQAHLAKTLGDDRLAELRKQAGTGGRFSDPTTSAERVWGGTGGAVSGGSGVLYCARA